jgi:hypothetical protein
MARAIRMSRGIVHRRSVLMLACLCTLVATGCVTTRFTMQKEFAYPVKAVVLSNPLVISMSYANAFEMTGPARIAMRAERVTHGRISMEITRASTSPLTLSVRTTPYEDSVLHRHGVRILIRGDSTTVESTDFRTVLATPLPVGKPFLFEIRNFGRSFQLRVGHTDCGLFQTLLPSTEWIMIATADTNRVLIGDPVVDTSI